MSEIDTNKKKSFRINLTMTEPFHEKLTEMCRTEGLGISELIRRALDEYHTSVFLKKHYGYKGSEVAKGVKMKNTKNEDRTEVVASLEKMTDDELTKHLLSVGFFSPDGPLSPHNPGDGRIRGDRIITDENGRFYVEFYFEDDTKTKVVYSRQVYSFTELIRELEKEKKLI
jgi:hypothetical protein